MHIFSKVTRNRISYENTPKHPPSPRSEHFILSCSLRNSGLLNLAYVLTDVVETLLYDLRSEMGKQGYELRYDAKRNFNTAIAAIRKLKQDVDKTQFSTQENFGNDSDCLLAFIRLLVDRCGDDDKKMFAFYNYIKRHPSQLGLELSDEKSVFAHIFKGDKKQD